MSDESYLIPGTNGRRPVMGHLTACRKCGRKVLVELALIGTPHHIAVMVNCGECLEEPSERIRKEHPEILAQVEKWLHGRSNQTEPEA